MTDPQHQTVFALTTYAEGVVTTNEPTEAETEEQS